MPVIEFQLEIEAPIERVFDLSRSIDVHLDSAHSTREVVVAGDSSGLLGPGEDVTWEAVHLGVRQRLTSRITIFDRPHHFRDSMVRGAFQRFDHDHFFDESGAVTIARERFDFTSPLGAVGRLADGILLERYMRRFLLERATVIKAIAESEDWRLYLGTSSLRSPPCE